MKKKVFILIGLIIVLFLLLFVYAFIISFKVIKQNTDNINVEYKKNFGKIVSIPEEIPPSLRSFEITNYTWEMITRENEVTTVTFSHQTGFDNSSDTLFASLEMTQGSDPSLFNKVLPAIINDSHTLEAIINLEDPNLGSNNQVGFRKIEFDFGADNAVQITKIIWEFDKNRIIDNTQEYFDKLYAYPLPVIKFLYSLQRSALIILAP